MKILNSIILLVVLSSSLIFAEGLDTDRPDHTESPVVQTKGSLQIESGLQIEYTESKEVANRSILAPSTLFRLGLCSFMELRFVSQIEYLKTPQGKSNGMGDMEFGAKFKILKTDVLNTQIGLVAHAIAPTGSTISTNDEWAANFILAVNHGINEQFSVGYNIGFNTLGDADNASDRLTYSFVLGMGIGEKAGCYIEIYGSGDYEMNMDAGFTYMLGHNFQLDCSFGTGIDHNMNYTALGFSWKID